MGWAILIGIVLVLGFLTAVAFSRRAELGRMERSVHERDEARRLGNPAALLQLPEIDLSRCMGCATCVAVCPETGVLELVHGQAAVVNGAGCMGVAACERECPVGAIEVKIVGAAERRDLPVLDEGLEAVGSSGLFLAGEVTALARIRVAIEHGTAVAREVARRVRAGERAEEEFDLVVVGAGPAGFACALEAQRQGLRFAVLDQAHDWGGTVANYPRRKLVLTEPVELPQGGRLDRRSYTKEELIELWLGIAREAGLELLGGRRFESLERLPHGGYELRCGDELFPARHVCLALGRRGSPRRLGVPGEELPKVAHSLVDAGSFQDRRLLVVGGGDSALEAACALASQPGNHVTLCHRRARFDRARAGNRERLERAVRRGDVELLLDCEVSAIRAEQVVLVQSSAEGPRALELANDEVFVMAGGLSPQPLLEAAGVSFDPELRAVEAPPTSAEPRDDGLRSALKVGLGLLVLAALFAAVNGDYYLLPDEERPAHPKHALLRPGLGLGLLFGVGALASIALNLAYLLRRSPRVAVDFGSIRSWMNAHVVTGIVAVVLAFLHASLRGGDSVGGHALLLLAGLLVTGAIGRWFYAWVPRAANGRELGLDELRARAHDLPQAGSGRWQAFGEAARGEVLQLIEMRQWRSGFFGRLLALLGVQRDLHRALGEIERRGLRERVPEGEIAAALELAREAHRQALGAAHYEDLRALASTWRYLHRWGAVLMVVLVLLHVVHALIYGDYFAGGGA